MRLTEDQVWRLNKLTDDEGYNGGYEIKRSLFKRRGPITVTWRDRNYISWRAEITSAGSIINRHILVRI